MDQFVVTAGGTITGCRNWFQAYDLDKIRPVVEAAGFDIQAEQVVAAVPPPARRATPSTTYQDRLAGYSAGGGR